MNVLTEVLMTAFEKKGVSIRSIATGTGKFLAAIPTWSAGQMAADKLTGGPRVEKENVYVPGPIYKRVLEQRQQALQKEQNTTGMKGV